MTQEQYELAVKEWREARRPLIRERQEIMNWFKRTDYYPHKIIRGEWTEEAQAWIDYKAEALIKSARLELLEAQLEVLEQELAASRATPPAQP